MRVNCLPTSLVSQSEVTKRQADYERAIAAVKAAEAARDEAQATVAQSAAAQAEGARRCRTGEGGSQIGHIRQR